MNAPAAGLSDPDAAPWWRRPETVLALAILLYGLGYLSWYLDTPLGRAPQLDGRENLALAAQIVAGTVPHEIFYRAMLYPAMLAAPLWLGLPAAALPALAALGGLLAHFAATLAVARLAARVWAGPRARPAALLAAALWGLNPVALFYAVNVLDVAPAIALAAWGLVFLATPQRTGLSGLVGGILLGLAVAARPHFLPMVVIAPLARAWLGGRWRPGWADAAAWAGAAVPLLILGLGQWAWAGEFRVLPWQGAYNFYAANRADANGRYYVQHMTFNDIAPGDNPARRESEAAYARATGATPPFAVDAMEAYWREQARAAIAANPIGWLKLMFLKTYYLFNDYDQYNNQTYAWHQARSPWLRWNFLGWGVLLVLAAGALGLALVRPLAVPAPAAGILLVFAAYGAGVLLYYASGRFRLPLAPLLCVLAGGWVEGLAHWLSPASPSSRRAAWVAGLAMLAAATLTFSTFFHACDDSTFLEDEMQVSSAASAIGDDALAYAMAQSAVARDPTRPDVRRLDMMCYFNLALTGPPAATTAAGWREQLTHLDGLDLLDPGQALVAGVACWKTGDQMRALQIWRDSAARAGPHSPPAQILAAAQVALGQAPPGVPPPDPDLLKILRGS